MKCKHFFLLLALQSRDTVKTAAFPTFTIGHPIFYLHLLPMDVAPGIGKFDFDQEKPGVIIQTRSLSLSLMAHALEILLILLICSTIIKKIHKTKIMLIHFCKEFISSI